MARSVPSPPVAGRVAGPSPRPLRRRILALVTTFVFVAGWSLGHALTTPGGGTVSERVAEWARTHYLSPLVTFGEWLTYNPPKKGGNPNVHFNKLGGKTVRRVKLKKHHHGLVPIIPANLGSLAGHPLAGEGQWREVETVKELPAVFKTYIRFSKTYSSYYAGVVSMDQRLVKFSLRPGTLDPGAGNWHASDLHRVRAPARPDGHVQQRVPPLRLGRRLLPERPLRRQAGQERGLRGVLPQRPAGDRRLGPRRSCTWDRTWSVCARTCG